MKLFELLQSAGLPLPMTENMEITGVASDSRRVRTGELFVAISGAHSDGVAHLGQAVANGAVFAVLPRAVHGTPQLVVEDTRAALARLLDAWHGHPAAEMCLVGITGTNGKTSTAWMLYHILRAAGCRCGLIGTVACLCEGENITLPSGNALANMTTPDPAELYAVLAEMRRRGAEYVVMEVTSHALAQGKVAPLRFARAVFTNLTPDHLDYHGDMEAYFAEKCKLFRQCDGAVVSTSTFFGARLLSALSVPAVEIGQNTLSGVVLHGSEGVSFTLCLGAQKWAFSLPVAGDFSVENGALAAATALSLGVEYPVVRVALAAFRGVPGRLERVPASGGVTVFLDYAHTPDALEKLLLTVRGFRAAGQRIVLLFGCGGDRDRTKRPEMGRIATRLADLTVLTSDNCRSERPEDIIRDVLRGMDREKPHRVIPDRREAIEWAVATARTGDILLLAGKGHENYEIRGNARLPFCEREIVRAAFAAREAAADED